MKILKDLVLALINATLILIVLALFLALRLTDRIENLGAAFAENLLQIEPLQTDVHALVSEVDILQTNLAALKAQADPLSYEAVVELQGKVNALNDKLSALQSSFDPLLSGMKTLKDANALTAARQIGDIVTGLSGCVPESQSVSSGLAVVRDAG
jgi:chromosome segregation ATPase